MEITRREVIASIAIIAILLTMGFFIGGKIEQNILEKNLEYDTAIKIDGEEDIFRHGMETSVGNAFVYGELKAIDPVTNEHLDGEYSYIKKEIQEYRKHTRIVTEYYTDSEGNRKSREVEEEYWTWDTIKTERKESTKISFLNVEFTYGTIPFPSAHYIKTVNTGFHLREEYYGTDVAFKGTIYASLRNGTIKDVSFYKGSIEDTVNRLESKGGYVIFWIFWILLIVGAVAGFYYLDNWWLNKD